MRFAGVVVAAGSGERFGRPKHLIEVGGVPMWRRGKELLEAAGITEVVVVGDVPGGVPGGPRRRDSVAAGLAALDSGADWVLVHDAARPLATETLARRVVERLMLGDADGVIPVVPVRDTIKRVDGDAVVETVERAPLVVAQTPQGFRMAALQAAQRGGQADASDEALLIEQVGGRVVTVPGDPTNFKVTYPGDLAVVEALL